MTTQHGALIQQAYVAAKTHAARSKGPIDPKDTAGHHPLPAELPTVPPELASDCYTVSPLSLTPGPLPKLPSTWTVPVNGSRRLGDYSLPMSASGMPGGTRNKTTTPTGCCPPGSKTVAART